jgi:hypothetical protein
MMKESKRLKKKATKRSAQDRKPTTRKRMVTNVDAAATTASKNTPRLREPSLESQMMKMISLKSTQDLQKDQ